MNWYKETSEKKLEELSIGLRLEISNVALEIDDLERTSRELLSFEDYVVLILLDGSFVFTRAGSFIVLL